MKKLIMSLMFMVLICIALPAMAQDSIESKKSIAEQKPGGVKSLEKRIKQLEEAIDRDVESDKWYDRIQISGLIEVEAGYSKFEDNNDPTADTDESDVDLATVELVVDAKIIKHVDGHVMFKYEEDDLFVDEGFITLVGTEAFPAYLIAGRQYIPFGYYDSHFVTDPNTLVLGETNQGAAVTGYRFGGGMVDLAVGAFNGEVDKAGEDNAIDSFVAAVTIQPLDFLMAGMSYTSNLSSSDSLSAAIEDIGVTELNDLVGGWSAFATVEFLDRFKVIAEYVAAVDDFEAGELYDTTDTQKRKPTAWNIELGVMIIEDLELALRYGGSDDGADFLPESQYGAVVNWGFFKNTSLALEYLHDGFEETSLAVDQEADTFTAQLTVEF